jgi:hypothetical protein
LRKEFHDELVHDTLRGKTKEEKITSAVRPLQFIFNMKFDSSAAQKKMALQGGQLKTYISNNNKKSKLVC